MPVKIPRGPDPATDEVLAAVVARVNDYLADHPGAEADVYRQGQYAIRIRITDSRFVTMKWVARHKGIWSYFDILSDEVVGDIYTLMCITAEERPESAASFEFDHPVAAPVFA